MRPIFVVLQNGALRATLLLFLIIGAILYIKANKAWGSHKANKIIEKELQQIQAENPYLYYRELPNHFGIGVATVLLDSTMENEKDLIAAILDLCAKGYLHLQNGKDNFYTIKVLKPIDEGLLSNEKYILQCCINGNLDELEYKKWFQYCVEDGIALGLFKKIDHISNPKETKQALLKKESKAMNIFYAVITMVMIIVANMLLTTYFPGSNVRKIISVILYVSIVVLFLYIFFIYPLIMTMGAARIVKFIGEEQYKESYNEGLSNYMKPTEKGEEELHKLYAFKTFLNDFGTFASKKPEEIMLWDYYLSYAQVFGIADKIQSLGYKQIVQNSSFKIDGLNTIELHQIKVQ